MSQAVVEQVVAHLNEYRFLYRLLAAANGEAIRCRFGAKWCQALTGRIVDREFRVVSLLKPDPSADLGLRIEAINDRLPFGRLVACDNGVFVRFRSRLPLPRGRGLVDSIVQVVLAHAVILRQVRRAINGAGPDVILLPESLEQDERTEDEEFFAALRRCGFAASP